MNTTMTMTRARLASVCDQLAETATEEAARAARAGDAQRAQYWQQCARTAREHGADEVRAARQRAARRTSVV